MKRRLSELMGMKPDRATVEIKGLTADSRCVSQGYLFAALPGSQADGRDYIDAAIKAGASAILTTPDAVANFGSIPVITDVNPRRKYAEMAAAFYGQQPGNMVAVTGTNGKTSVADFTRQIWTLNGKNAASLGTIGVHSEKVTLPGGLTTPDPVALHSVLNDLQGAGVTHAALEASSHGLDQYRLDGVRLCAAAFTNLTRDHLDYHLTEASYFYAKARLFGELLAPGSTAVINISDSFGKDLDDMCWGRGLKRFTVGYDPKATLYIKDVDLLPNGQRVTVYYDGCDFTMEVPLVGSFQIENALLAVGLASVTGVDTHDALSSLTCLDGVSGRMQFMGSNAAGGSVFVDFAHTPSGLETVLQAARAHNPSSLSVVFGCGGDRDAGKRPQMGEIAARLADKVFITDDNPRFENASSIRSEIMSACPDGVEIGDRKSAIEEAVRTLKKGEMLVIAGKGHETGQVIGDEVVPHSDLDVVADLLSSQTTNGGSHV